MSLIRKHVAVLQAWACLDLVLFCYFLLSAVVTYSIVFVGVFFSLCEHDNS